MITGSPIPTPTQSCSSLQSGHCAIVFKSLCLGGFCCQVQIIKSPALPSKLRPSLTDYVSLAKTRLVDLKVSANYPCPSPLSFPSRSLPLLPSPLLPSPPLSSPLLSSPLLSSPLLSSPLLPSPLLPSPILPSPLLPSHLLSSPLPSSPLLSSPPLFPPLTSRLLCLLFLPPSFGEIRSIISHCHISWATFDPLGTPGTNAIEWRKLWCGWGEKWTWQGKDVTRHLNDKRQGKPCLKRTHARTFCTMCTDNRSADWARYFKARLA